MIKVYESQNLVEVESLKEILDQAEIHCTIKNQHTAMLAGGIPFAEVFPELWITRDEDYPKAKDIFDNWPKACPVEASPWTCSHCGEAHTMKFSACWKCGNERK